VTRLSMGKMTGVLLLAAFVLSQPAAVPAQEAAGKPEITIAGPIATMRDALMASCAENEKDFVRFLTARNAEAFATLTPAARVALMKRLVLLAEPGKPSVQASTSGRPLVRCETPAGAAEMQIGGSAVTDNLAFLPVEIRDATDSVGNNVMHVQMGLVRENGEWKLLSLGLVLLDLPALATEWDAAEIDSTERAAVVELKKIAEAVEAYRRTYSRLPDALEKLGPPTRGAGTPDAAGLLDAESASGAKDGYRFRYIIATTGTLGAPAKFDLAATPQAYGRTGKRSFFRDSDGVLHGADRKGAVGSESDPKIE
jgi:hypothetical protein